MGVSSPSCRFFSCCLSLSSLSKSFSHRPHFHRFPGLLVSFRLSLFWSGSSLGSSECSFCLCSSRVALDVHASAHMLHLHLATFLRSATKISLYCSLVLLL